MEPVVHLLLYIGLMQSSAVGCVPQQCGSLLPIFTVCTDDAYFGGGDNVIALCHDTKGNLAVRFSVLEDLPRHDSIHLLKGQKLAGSLCRGDPTQAPIVQKLRPAVQNAPLRLVVSMSQYDGEIRWRDEFSWRRMVFAPAASLYECKTCLKLCSRVPVMNWGGEEVANLSRSVQIGVSIMKGVDGAFGQLCNQLSIQALSTILVGYHLDLATMADSNHFHDAHAGNILLSLTSKADPEVRWHDFAGTLGSSADFKVLASQAFMDDFARKIEQFSDIVINRIKTMHEEFATRLNETRKKCKMIGQTMLQVRSCLRKRAISAVATMLEVNAMTRSDQQKLLEKISAGMPDDDLEELWQQFLQGATGKRSLPVWVRPLQQDGAGRLELVGNAFKITGEIADIDDLKKAIKKENPATVLCDAFQIDIYLQQEGSWKKESKMSASLRDNDEDSPYGYFLPKGLRPWWSMRR